MSQEIRQIQGLHISVWGDQVTTMTIAVQKDETKEQLSSNKKVEIHHPLCKHTDKLDALRSVR